MEDEAPSTPGQRMAGMVIYTAALLFFLWYWPPGEYQHLSLSYALSVWPSSSADSLAGNFLTSTFTDSASDQYELQQRLWLYTQLLVPASAWLLRGHLGALIAKMHRAV